VRRLVVLALAALALSAPAGARAAGWCGAGEASADLPDATTGRQIHPVWAVPADGADTFATGAPKVADDLASITSWWVGQDPTREPRIDDAVFPGGTCADISFVRLPAPGTSYVGASAAFDTIASQLAAAGFGNPFKKYLVYYDGPAVQENVCGTGGGDFSTGPSYAVVWLAGCPRVPTDGVAAHELLHALGALPPGAPHACPGDPGHPCDSPQDVLYPYASGAPLAQLLLDAGHDDYYGHTGAWVDLQDSLWLHLLGAPELPVTLTIVGAGAVSSDVPGIACTATCTTQWDGGSAVALTATPASGTRFVGWSGSCNGSTTCDVTVAAPTSVTASFGPLRIPVSVHSTGKGAVRCTPVCGKTATAGKPLVLRAVPARGWRFVSWSGDCAGVRVPTCRPKTDYHVTARATFKRLRRR
jgi:Divergent InlB B-repeat domain